MGTCFIVKMAGGVPAKHMQCPGLSLMCGRQRKERERKGRGGKEKEREGEGREKGGQGSGEEGRGINQ